jgi:hypothetical protein
MSTSRHLPDWIRSGDICPTSSLICRSRPEISEPLSVREIVLLVTSFSDMKSLRCMSWLIASLSTSTSERSPSASLRSSSSSSPFATIAFLPSSVILTTVSFPSLDSSPQPFFRIQPMAICVSSVLNFPVFLRSASDAFPSKSEMIVSTTTFSGSGLLGASLSFNEYLFVTASSILTSPLACSQEDAFMTSTSCSNSAISSICSGLPLLMSLRAESTFFSK